MNSNVDDFIARISNWQKELEAMRLIVLDCGLTEELKWAQPCYTFNKANLLILANFKQYCAISFLKGALLTDTENVLESPGKNSQAVRFMKFKSVDEINDKESTIKAYIYEAIEIENLSLKIDFKEKKELVFPEELKLKMEMEDSFKIAFEALTPGKQRGYNLYFTAPKNSATRTKRIDQYMQKILDGKGFLDCNCGHSKKMPRCDGSHKFIK